LAFSFDIKLLIIKTSWYKQRLKKSDNPKGEAVRLGKETARKSSETNVTKAGRERQDKTATANQSSDKSPQIGLRAREAYSCRSTTKQQIFVILPSNMPSKPCLETSQRG